MYTVRRSSFCGGINKLISGQFCAGFSATTVNNVKDACFVSNLEHVAFYGLIKFLFKHIFDVYV